MTRPASAILTMDQKAALRQKRDELKTCLAFANREVKKYERELAAVNKKLKG